jgi:hypothetical protein
MTTTETIQAILDEIVRRATEAGYPPELTYKAGLLQAKEFDFGTLEENVSGHLIEAYRSKGGLRAVFAIAFEVMGEFSIARKELTDALNKGIDDLDAGRVVPGDVARERALAKINARRAGQTTEPEAATIMDKGPWKVAESPEKYSRMMVKGEGLDRGLQLEVCSDHLGIFPEEEAIARVIGAIIESGFEVDSWGGSRQHFSLQSDDFTYDASINFFGDFGGDDVKRAYAESLARQLNDTRSNAKGRGVSGVGNAKGAEDA